jgi:hypothetical protein
MNTNHIGSVKTTPLPQAAATAKAHPAPVQQPNTADDKKVLQEKERLAQIQKTQNNPTIRPGAAKEINIIA